MEPKQPLPTEHAEALLLPAFISRTLSSEERSQVERHLQSCTVCQEELQEMTAMQSALQSVIHTRSGPSPAAFAKVMSRIHQESAIPAEEVPERTDHSWWESLEQAFRSVFEVRWVPVLASFLIVGQAVLLLSLLGGLERQNGTPMGPVIERGIPQGTPAAPLITVQVEFVETAQEFQIRRLISDFKGKIVGGPTKDGLYIIEFQPQDTSSESLLSALRLHPDLIRTVKPLQP